MTDLSRGARVRRGGRRPGWVLLTALLVLAIGASSALVFTNRVELLKLAVILEGIHYRHLHGQTVGAGYEHVGALAEPLAEAGLTALKTSQELECQAAGLLSSR